MRSKYEQPFEPDETGIVAGPQPLTEEGDAMLRSILMLDELPRAAQAWREADATGRASIETNYPAVLEQVALEDLMAANTERTRQAAELIVREEFSVYHGPFYL